MGISRKIPKLTCLIIILTILAFLGNITLLTKSVETQSPLLQITAKTDKQSYLLRQKVTIEGNITKDGTPATDLVVVIQAENPRGTRVACRTLTIGSPTQEWLINITNLFLMDMGNNLINTAKIGTQIQAGITIYNWQMTARNVFATVTVFDANMVPIHIGVWSGTLDPQQTMSPRFSVYIEKWACTGKILVCGNVYNKEPKTGGIALSQEKTAYFCISKTQQGLFEYPELSPPPPQTTPGNYNTYIRLSPEPLAGQYTLYITAQASPAVRSFTSTTFNVQNSAGYPPQASFAYWPAKPYENQTVTFDASSSTAEGFNDTIIKYEWDFGDGTPKIIKEGNPPDPTTSHAYLNTGQYIITLNVTDNEGLWSTTSKPITIYPEYGPKANFTWTPTASIVNQTITFNASNSQVGWTKTLGDYSPITNYNWNFSDGTIINTANPITTHNYTKPANYTVTLTITDSIGRTDKASTIIQVFNVTAVPWDVNGDRKVDIKDILLVAKAYGTKEGDPNWDPRCDVNGDLKVDIKDILIVAKHYGESY